MYAFFFSSDDHGADHDLPLQVESKEQARPFWSQYPSMTVLPLNSVIARVDCIPNQMLYVKGYALAGSSGNVKAVELTLDEGKSWQPAKILYQEGRWSWTIWEAELECSAEKGTIFSRAIDTGGNVQPKDGVWNIRGVAYNGWGRGTWYCVTLFIDVTQFNKVLYNHQLTSSNIIMLGRLVHYTVDAVLVSTVIAGVKRSSGFSSV
jgi:hypothetical protein